MNREASGLTAGLFVRYLLVQKPLPEMMHIRAESRPTQCVYCSSPILQRWGGRLRAVKDPHIHRALVYRYRCCQCRRTLRQAQGRLFRHYPEGITHAGQSRRLVQFAALCWVLGLSPRGNSAILSVWHSQSECLSNPLRGLPFPVALSHMSVWRDLQAQAVVLKRRLPGCGCWVWMGCIHVSPGRSNHSGERGLGQRPASGARGHPRERLVSGGQVAHTVRGCLGDGSVGE